MRRWRDWLVDCMEIRFGKSAKLDGAEVCTHICRVIWKKQLEQLWLLYPKSPVPARPIRGEYERRRVVVLNESEWGLSYGA